LCGECDVGCNEGSKNTLDYNYLSEAKRHDADIRTLCEVKTFMPIAGGGFTVKYAQHDLEREGTKLDPDTIPNRTITAGRLILSAGTLGTTYLLLRNREAVPGISSLLGTRFCGNGDLLTFALSCRDSENGAGRALDPSYGPVITGAIRYPDALDDPAYKPESGPPPAGAPRGMYIEDAGYPAFMSWLVETANSMSVMRRVLRFAWHRIRAVLSRDAESDMSAEVSRMLGDCNLSSNSVPLLGMGRDTPDGVMRLRDGWLDIDWRTRGSTVHFTRMREAMGRIVKGWRGRFLDNPLWYLNRVITVHPVGGCPMGRHIGEAVVDSFGSVFGVPDLTIADGSIMPGPVGANPSLTIAALAERSAARLIETGR
jgi:cholesterol oxidase